MHILGKVLLWLCVVLLIPASLVLSTMVLDVRHRMLKQVTERQERIEKGIQQIADAERRVRALEEQRQALVHGWGDVWNSPNSQVQPGTPGAIELGVGSSSGLPQRGTDGKIDPSVFVFADAPGSSLYLGEFSITDIRPSQAIARLTRPPYPQETDLWPRGTYHIRGTLPANWLATIASLQHQQVIADSALIDHELELATRKELIKSSQATLAQRMAELNGNPQAAPDAGDEVRDGLVESLRKYETARNDQLAEVDRLRRKMIDDYSELRRTLQRCVEKAQILNQKYGTQPAPVETTQSETAASEIQGNLRK
ncbi:hypothetical protein SH661x_000477 [Planctomicrobium sp. SH661]|uniref:hypothetical protein n=1 Tax=Planctomicrobium sp. SH661 TaxID=3448124 RepID=UPI003F5C3CDA